MSRRPGAHIRVLIVDDQDLYRRGLAILLAAEDDIEVAAEAAGRAEALELVTVSEPDVVLLDVSLTDGDGPSAPDTVAQLATSAKVLMLANSEAEPGLEQALVGGAHGYLLKRTPIEQLAGAVRAVVAVEFPL
ncbi:MAG: response regulator transcription factor [Nocardioidaceae bacterium]|nr:response regulator transcription factor [Nocardioidaceae bacterium]